MFNSTMSMVNKVQYKYRKEAVPGLAVGGEQIERVDTFKLLGVIFNIKLTWDDHITYILRKVSKRFYVIFQLTRIGVPQRDIIYFDIYIY